MDYDCSMRKLMLFHSCATKYTEDKSVWQGVFREQWKKPFIVLTAVLAVLICLLFGCCFLVLRVFEECEQIILEHESHQVLLAALKPEAASLLIYSGLIASGVLISAILILTRAGS